MGRSGAQALSFYGKLELGPALDPLESLEEILDFLYTKSLEFLSPPALTLRSPLL